MADYISVNESDTNRYKGMENFYREIVNDLLERVHKLEVENRMLYVFLLPFDNEIRSLNDKELQERELNEYRTGG